MFLPFRSPWLGFTFTEINVSHDHPVPPRRVSLLGDNILIIARQTACRLQQQSQPPKYLTMGQSPSSGEDWAGGKERDLLHLALPYIQPTPLTPTSAPVLCLQPLTSHPIPSHRTSTRVEPEGPGEFHRKFQL